jgi:hypothetical protein
MGEAGIEMVGSEHWVVFKQDPVVQQGALWCKHSRVGFQAKMTWQDWVVRSRRAGRGRSATRDLERDEFRSSRQRE